MMCTMPVLFLQTDARLPPPALTEQPFAGKLGPN
jgi:hypothetical protein